MTVLGLADFGNIAAEFAGLASGMGVFGVSKYIAVPLGAGWSGPSLFADRTNRSERVLLVLSMSLFRVPDLGHSRSPGLESRASKT